MKRLIALAFICLATASWAGRLTLLGAGPTSSGGAPSCSINLDFTTGSLPGGVTMTGAANAAHYDSTSHVVVSGANVARFDYDPTSHAFKGLLVEPSRTNYHPEGNGGSWALNNGSFTFSVADPRGGTTAQGFVENSTNSEHHTTFTIATLGITSQQIDISFFAQPALGTRYIAGNFADTNTYGSFTAASFNPATGAVAAAPSVGGAGDFASPSAATVQAINISGNTWQRYAWTVTIGTANKLYTDFVLLQDASLAFTYLGNGTSGINIWGFQVSAHSIANTPIDTSAIGTSLITTADTVSFSNPVCTQMTFTFDDNSTQTITGISAGTYTVPTNLNRPWIKTIVGAP